MLHVACCMLRHTAADGSPPAPPNNTPISASSSTASVAFSVHLACCMLHIARCKHISVASSGQLATRMRTCLSMCACNSAHWTHDAMVMCAYRRLCCTRYAHGYAEGRRRSSYVARLVTASVHARVRMRTHGCCACTLHSCAPHVPRPMRHAHAHAHEQTSMNSPLTDRVGARGAPSSPLRAARVQLPSERSLAALA